MDGCFPAFKLTLLTLSTFASLVSDFVHSCLLLHIETQSLSYTTRSEIDCTLHTPHAMAPFGSGSGNSHASTLSPSHPLMAELASLRQQLAQFQKSGHQSAIQLQGARLELSLAKEESQVLKETNDTLRSELEVLR